MNRTLVVISVPFARNSRHLLSSPLFERLRAGHDVLVVSPFAGEERFREEFGGPRTRFYTFTPRDLSGRRLLFVLYALSEMLRFQGFYFRFRGNGLGYYWHTSTTGTFGVNGEDRTYPALRRLLLRLIGALGAPGWTWRAVERLFGRFFYDTAPIRQIVREYDRVVVVQTASFGDQERFLSHCVRSLGLRSVLVPYTTDQLLTNGFLLSDFERVFSQGPRETEAAARYHRLPPEKIVRHGSLWFRNLDRIRESVETEGARCAGRRVVMYAGSTSTYFPHPSEFAAVDALVAAVREGTIPGARVVYRPIPQNDRELAEIQERYGARDDVELQLPQLSVVGMSSYTSGSTRQELRDYVAQLLAVDVFVMSFMTTMCLDAYYLGRPVVSNCTDPSGTLWRRGTQLLLGADVGGLVKAGMPIARSLDELVREVRDALEDPASHQATARAVTADWDHASPDYVERFLEGLR